MTTTIEEPTLVLISARVVLLDRTYNELPDPDEQTTVKATEHAATQRHMVSQRRQQLRFHADRVARLDLRLPGMHSWKNLLLAARSAFEQELAGLEGEKKARSIQQDQREDGLRASLKAIRVGVEYCGPMTLVPMPLVDFLRAQGVVPLPGEHSVWSAGYGSLFATEEQITQAERERADAMAHIAAELATPVDVVPRVEVTI